jgi:hypothetical protein
MLTWVADAATQSAKCQLSLQLFVVLLEHDNLYVDLAAAICNLGKTIVVVIHYVLDGSIFDFCNSLLDFLLVICLEVTGHLCMLVDSLDPFNFEPVCFFFPLMVPFLEPSIVLEQLGLHLLG